MTIKLQHKLFTTVLKENLSGVYTSCTCENHDDGGVELNLATYYASIMHYDPKLLKELAACFAWSPLQFGPNCFTSVSQSTIVVLENQMKLMLQQIVVSDPTS